LRRSPRPGPNATASDIGQGAVNRAGRASPAPTRPFGKATAPAARPGATTRRSRAHVGGLWPRRA